MDLIPLLAKLSLVGNRRIGLRSAVAPGNHPEHLPHARGVRRGMLLPDELVDRNEEPRLLGVGEGSPEVTVWRAPHAMGLSEQYQESPFATIVNGEGGVRRRLDGPDPKLDYPVLEDLRAEGASGYVAMLMRFSERIKVARVVMTSWGMDEVYVYDPSGSLVKFGQVTDRSIPADTVQAAPSD